MKYESMNWPTWQDGNPVKVGEVAMSLRGPMRVDGMEITATGWRLWSTISGPNGSKWLYIIDEGGERSHPTREGEPCDFWHEGDPTTPEFVFAGKEV